MNNPFGIAKIHSVGSIPDRLQLIAKQIDASIKDPWTRAMSLEIVRGGQMHGSQAEDDEIARVFWFMKHNVEYRQDPRDYDYYPTAKRVVQLGGEDCDGHVVANNAFLGSLGFMTGAKVISPDDQNWHIYSMAGVNTRANPSQRIMLDSTQPGSYPGWEPGIMHQRYIYECTFSNGAAHWKKVR